MYSAEVVLELAAVVLLAGYLYHKHHQRLKDRLEPRDPSEWLGTPIDVSSLRPRIDCVRRNHFAAPRPAPGFSYRRLLLSRARRTVRHLASLRERENEAQEPAPPSSCR